MNKLLFLVVLLLLSSCGTTTVTACKHKIGVEKEMCLEQVRRAQQNIWKYRTNDGLL